MHSGHTSRAVLNESARAERSTESSNPARGQRAAAILPAPAFSLSLFKLSLVLSLSNRALLGHIKRADNCYLAAGLACSLAGSFYNSVTLLRGGETTILSFFSLSDFS